MRRQILEALPKGIVERDTVKARRRHRSIGQFAMCSQTADGVDKGPIAPGGAQGFSEGERPPRKASWAPASTERIWTELDKKKPAKPSLAGFFRPSHTTSKMRWWAGVNVI